MTAGVIHPAVTVAAVNETPPQNVVLGAGLITLAFLFTALMSAIGKKACDVPTPMIVFFQSLISLILFLPWSLKHGVEGLATKKLPLHFVRAVGGLLSQACTFIALRRMPLMNTVLLSNAAPLFIPIVALLWLHEKITLKTAMSLLVGFVGVMLILKPNAELLNNPAALIATIGAVCSAIALVTVNRLSTTEPSRRVLFYYFALATLCTAPFLPFIWKTPTKEEWIALTLIGVLQASSQFLIIEAYRYAKPGQIAPFNYSVVVFSGLLGWLIWGTKPDAMAVGGVVLVCAGGVFATLKASPNGHGHFGWIGHWNALHLHRKQREKEIVQAAVAA